jgi:hypothetical protein
MVSTSREWLHGWQGVRPGASEWLVKSTAGRHGSNQHVFPSSTTAIWRAATANSTFETLKVQPTNGKVQKELRRFNRGRR